MDRAESAFEWDLLYKGQFRDAETGILHYGFRSYVPMLGRWINRDPIDESGGMNLYAFVKNNCINGSDFFGLIKPGDYIDPEQFSNLSQRDKNAWANSFRNRFFDQFQAAKDNCVPQKLIAAMIANEMTDWSFPDGSILDGLGGGGIGPAQIAYQTSLDHKLWDRFTLVVNPKATLRTDQGSTQLAGALVGDYVRELCDSKQSGTFGSGFRNEYTLRIASLIIYVA